jgi:hypothetical protein
LDRTGKVEAARRYGGEGSQYTTAVQTDAQGNAYLVGPFEGTLDFGSGITLTTSGAEAYSHVFIAALDADGLARWARQLRIDGEVGTILGAEAVAVDSAGAVFVSGPIEGVATIDGNAFGDGALRNYLLKLGPDAAFQWVDLFPGPDQTVIGLEVDSSGNVYAAADDGRGSALYVFKWTGAGARVAEKRYPGTSEQLASVHDLAVTDDAVYLAGAGAFGVQPENQSFLAVLDPALEVTTLTPFPGMSVRHLATTPGGEVLLAGSVQAGSPAGAEQSFAALMGTGSTWQWFRVFGGNGRITSLSATPFGEALLGGHFSGAFDLGAGAIEGGVGVSWFAGKLAP